MILLKLYYQKFVKRMTIRKSGIPLNIWKTLPNNSIFFLNTEKSAAEKYHYFNLPKLNINDENFWENYILLFKRVQFMASSNYEYNQLYLVYLADKIVEFSYDSKNIDFEIIALIEIFLGRDYSDTELEFNKRYNKEIPKRIKRPESIIEFYETCINLKKKYDIEFSKNFYSYDNIIHFLLEYYKNSSFNSPRFYFLFFSIKSNLAFFECFKFNNVFYKKFFDFSCETLYDYNILCKFYEKKIQNLSQKGFLKSMYTNISSFFFELFSSRKSHLISLKNISFKNIFVFLYPTHVKQVLPYYISSLKNFNIFNVRLDFNHQAWRLPVFFYRISGLFEFLEKNKENFLFVVNFYNIVFFYKRIKKFFMSIYEELIVDGLNFTGTRIRLFIFRVNKTFYESLRNKKYGVALFFWKKYHKNDFKNFEPFSWAYIVYFTYNMEKLYGVLGFDSLLHVDLPKSVKFHVNKFLKLTKKSNVINLTTRLKNLYYYRYNLEFKYIKLYQKISTLGYIRSFFLLFFFNLYFKSNFYLIYFLIKRASLLFSMFFFNLELTLTKNFLKFFGKKINLNDYKLKKLKNIKNSFIHLSFLDNSLFTKDIIRFFYLNEITFFYNTLKLNNNLFKNIHKLNYKYLFKNIYLILKLFINYSKFNLCIFLNKLSFDLVTLFNSTINEVIWFKSFLISLPSLYYKIIAFDASKYFLNVAEKIKTEFNLYKYIKLNIIIFFEKIINFFYMVFEKFIILIKKTYKTIIKIIKWFFTFLKNIIIFNFNFINTIIKMIKPFFFNIRDYIVSFFFDQLIILKVFLRYNNSLSYFKAILFYFWELLFALFRIAFFFIPLFYLIFYVNDFISYLQEFEYLDYLSTCTVYSLLWTFIYIYFFIFFFPILTFIRNIPRISDTFDSIFNMDRETAFRSVILERSAFSHSVWAIDVTSKEWPRVQEKIKKYPELSKYIKTNIKDLDGMSDLRFNSFIHTKEQMGSYFQIFYTVEDFNEVLEHFDEILRNYSGVAFEYEDPDKWQEKYSEFLLSGSIDPNYVPIKGYEEVYKKSLYYYNEALKLGLTTPDADPAICPIKLNTYYRRTLVKNELMSKLSLISENDWQYPGFCKLFSEAFLSKYAKIEEEFVVLPKDRLFDEERILSVPLYYKLPCFLPQCKNNKILNDDDDVSSFKNMLPIPKSLIMDTNILMSVKPGIAPKYYEKKAQELLDEQTREHKSINLELGEDLSLEEAMAWKIATSKDTQSDVRADFWGSMFLNVILIVTLFCASLWFCISPDGEQMIDPFFNVWDGAQYSIEYWFNAQEFFDFHRALTDQKFGSFLVEHKQTSLIFDKNHKPMYKSTVTYSRMTEEEFKNFKVDRKTVEFKRNVRQREQT